MSNLVDNNDINFSEMQDCLSSIKKQITNMQQEMKIIEKKVKAELKETGKGQKKPRKSNKSPSGFAKASRITPELSKFMSRESGVDVARTEVTQFIIKYIKEHNLQKIDNRRVINADDNLKELLGLSDVDELTYFNLQKYMNKHFHSKKDEIEIKEQ